MVATAQNLKQSMGLHIVRKDVWIPDELKFRMTSWQPKTLLGAAIKDALHFLPAEQAGELIRRVTSCVVLESSLAWVVRYLSDSPARHGGPCYQDRGIVSRRVVTTEGVTALCVAWGSAAFNMIYMGLTTVATAAANTDTAANRFDAASEIAAANYTGSVRPTCTTPQSTNTIPMVGVHTQATAGNTIESHGILDSATRAAGLLWDRHVTGTTVLAVGDGITATYTLTASSE